MTAISSRDYFSFHVIDVNQNVALSSPQKVTVYPGQPVKLTGEPSHADAL